MFCKPKRLKFVYFKIGMMRSTLSNPVTLMKSSQNQINTVGWTKMEYDNCKYNISEMSII